MRHFLFHFLAANFKGPAVYVGVLFILVLCGLGVPMPEDVPLITGGWLVGKGGIPYAMIAVGLLGILIGDSIIFKAGQTYGEKLLETRLGKHIRGERVQDTIVAFEKHGPKFIMVARFVPGLRAVTYFVAGTTRVPYWTFITFDAIAALVSAPLWVMLGWYARQKHMLAAAWRWAARAQVLLAVVIGSGLAIWFAIAWARRRRRRGRRERSDAPLARTIDLAARRR